MSTINRNIIRGVLISTYVIAISVSVFGISALYSYLNTGADRSSMLHTKLKKVEQYLPKVTWAPLKNEGRLMDSVTLKAIEIDYLDAWYVRHIAFKLNTKEGIKEYYTKRARQNLYNTVDLNTAENITIASTTLQHDPTLEFFSEDGQFVVITDRNVIEYKQIYKDEQLLVQTTEKSTYKIILLLEDGFWRIRHFIKQETEIIKEDYKPRSSIYLAFKGINYYPQATPWDMFGTGFNIKTIANDFAIIKDAGLNTIRVFIPYDDFGKANVKSEKLKKLKQVLDAATHKKLKVMVTLFDFYGDYSVLDWTLNRKHAETIVSNFKNHSAIMAWDIKNEPDLDFKSRQKTLVTAWLLNMLSHVKSIDSKHPVTIGWSNSESAPILKDNVDFVSFHYYKKIKNLASVYGALKKEIPNKSIVLSEFGLTSHNGIGNFFTGSEANQAKYHKKMQAVMESKNIPFMSWTLYDFNYVPKAVVGRLPWRRNIQEKFGFISTDGAKKISFQFISNSEDAL